MKRFFFAIALLIIVSRSMCFSQTLCAMVTLPDNSHAYINEKGTILYKENPDIVTKEQIFPMSDGLCRIRRNGKFGFIDYKGQVVIPVELEKAEDFHEGLSAAKINGKWCYINSKGEIVIKAGYKNIHKFSCGMAVVGRDGNYGYIDVQGNMVVPAQFDRVCHFKDNKAWVLTNGHWDCIDKKGNYIIKPYYLDTQDFSEGRAWVKKDNIWGLIDTAGKYIIAPDERNPLIYAQSATYKNFGKYNSGLLISKAYDKFGYCDFSLKKVIPSKFDKAFDFENGMARACINDLWGIIDTTGKFILEPIYKDIKYAGNNICAVKVKGGLWGFIDMKGNWLVLPAYQWVYDFEQIND